MQHPRPAEERQGCDLERFQAYIKPTVVGVALKLLIIEFIIIIRFVVQNLILYKGNQTKWWYRWTKPTPLG